MIYMISNAFQQAEAYTYEEDNVNIWKNKTAFLILQHLCLSYGCTYEGRKAAAQYLLHCTQKVPILVSERKGGLFFPTRDVRSLQCCWLNYDMIKKVKRIQKQTQITFCNGYIVVLDCDKRGIDRSMTLCKSYLNCLHSNTRISYNTSRS